MNNVKDIYKSLRVLVKDNIDNDNDIIILNIGTDRSTGDCLGPLVGSNLEKSKLKKLLYFGTIDNPIHGGNLDEAREMLSTKYPNAFIIAVDAGLGDFDSIGSTFVRNRPLRPGAGVKKDLGNIGDVSVVGVVNIGGYLQEEVLKSTRLSTVVRMSNDITDAILLLDKYINRKLKEKDLKLMNLEYEVAVTK